jgi:hypothetical protein
MRNFKPYELVPKATYEKLGDEGSLKLIKPECQIALDNLSDFFSLYRGEHCPLSVNDWHKGGTRQFCGWRPEECVDADGHPVGAGHSQHKDGNADDVHCQVYTAEQMREIVFAHKDDPLLQTITRIEAGVTWLHFDLMTLPEGMERIHFFRS